MDIEHRDEEFNIKSCIYSHPVACERCEDQRSSLFDLKLLQLACSPSMLVTQICALLRHAPCGGMPHLVPTLSNLADHPSLGTTRHGDMVSVNRPHPRLSRPISQMLPSPYPSWKAVVVPTGFPLPLVSQSFSCAPHSPIPSNRPLPAQ